MTTLAQDLVIERLAIVYGGTNVIPLRVSASDRGASCRATEQR